MQKYRKFDETDCNLHDELINHKKNKKIFFFKHVATFFIYLLRKK